MHTPELKINTAIAEAVGWKVNHFKEGEVEIDYWHHIDGRPGTPPNFCGDLNAIAQAEAMLTDEQHNKYRHILAKVCGVGHANRAYGLYAHRNLVSAPAKERATAFVRALNLEPKSK